MTSSLAESNLQSALAESQRGITELKDIVVKKLSDDKSDNPRLGFCHFLKVEVVQLTSDSYDKFQQETFNLVMRLTRRDKLQQMYQHTISMSMAQTATYSQASTSHQYPLTPRCGPHSSRCNRHLHMYHKHFHSSRIYNIHSSTFNRHLLRHMHQHNSRSTARLYSKTYRYLILSRLCSTRQAMTMTCCICFWKILKRDARILKAFSSTLLPRLIL